MDTLHHVDLTKVAMDTLHHAVLPPVDMDMLHRVALVATALVDGLRRIEGMTAGLTFPSKYLQRLHEELPWVLLPDAICAYTGARPISHFEEEAHGNRISGMVFPSAETLKSLTKDNVYDKIKLFYAGNTVCAIGENTNLQEFDMQNWSHPHYNALRCHLRQDIALDEMLRNEMIDVSHRFADVYTIKHDGKVLSGSQLRAQIARFQELGFVFLVGKVYEKTGLLLTREWFDNHVLRSLREAYPEDLATSTYSFMRISDELNIRIKALNFDLTEEEKASVIITKDLERAYNQLYSQALFSTIREL